MKQRPRRAAEKAPEGALVRVKWLDADCGSGETWSDRKAELRATPTVIESVGWKVGTNEHYLVLCSDRYDDTIGGVSRIPLTWIIRFEHLEARNG